MKGPFIRELVFDERCRFSEQATQLPDPFFMPIARCIFCKSNENEFTSCEHIIPESLGNTEHVLRPGIVCDRCNNYFARKVEAPVLNSCFFKQARSRNAIANKRRRVPPLDVLSYPKPVHLQIATSTDGERSIFPADDSDNALFVDLLHRQKRLTLVLPVSEPPSGRLFGRFLAKMAIEAWAKKLIESSGDLSVDLIDKSELKEMRRFARYGEGVSSWPYSTRQLYAEDHLFEDDDGTNFQMLHEYTLLYTESKELYFVVAILGIEFAINLGGPFNEGFHQWLDQNPGQGPLYSDGLQ